MSDFIEQAEARRIAAEEADAALTELGERRRAVGRAMATFKRAVVLESSGPSKRKRELVACDCGLMVFKGPGMTSHKRGRKHRARLAARK